MFHQRAAFFLVFTFGLFSLWLNAQDTVAINALLKEGSERIHNKKTDAAAVFEQALYLSKKTNYSHGESVAMFNLAVLKSGTDFYGSVNLFKAVLPFFIRRDDEEKVAGILYTLSSMYEQHGNLDTAIFYTIQSIEYHQKTNPSNPPVWSFVQLSSLYSDIEQYDKARLYAYKALSYSQVQGYQAYRAMANIAVSKAYKGQLLVDSCIHYARFAMVGSDNVGDFYSCQIYDNLAEMYNFGKMPDSALMFATKALQTLKENNVLLMHRFYTYLGFAEAYLLKDETAKCLEYLEKAGALPGIYNYSVQKAYLYQLSALANFKMGAYKAAYLFKDSAREAFVKLASVRNRFAIAEVETRFSTVQKEKELSQKQLQLSEKEVQLQKSHQVLYGVVGGLVMALLLAGLLYANSRNKKKAHQRELQNIRQEREIQLLQSVMEGEEKERSRIAKDLHDGVAAMLSAARMHLSSVAIKNKSLEGEREFSQAVKLLDDSCQEVRLTSHNLMPEILMQHGLSEAIRRFCANISNDHVLRVQYAAYGEIGRFSLHVELSVYRIVQELLNNVLKHSKASESFVQLNVQNDFLSLTIEDNGVGFQAGCALPNGTGLHSLRRRVQAMNGILEIDAQPQQGMTAFIGIDITNYKSNT